MSSELARRFGTGVAPPLGVTRPPSTRRFWGRFDELATAKNLTPSGASLHDRGRAREVDQHEKDARLPWRGGQTRSSTSHLGPGASARRASAVSNRISITSASATYAL